MSRPDLHPSILLTTFILYSEHGAPIQPRLPFHSLGPGGYQALLALEKYLKTCGLEENLLHLLKLRASQMNGCAYCMDMHWKDLRALGETEQRLYALDAWREAPFYTDRERAALEWCEALTNITDGHVPDALYDRVKSQFTDKELADLGYLLATINAWNRLAIAFRSPAGLYQPPKRG